MSLYSFVRLVGVRAKDLTPVGFRVGVRAKGLTPVVFRVGVRAKDLTPVGLLLLSLVAIPAFAQ
ncbi:MAG: hypothetical protein O6938_09805, partial [Gammaproteobacteria bacterium]|nr:hypothetical protein [Gammaproteobacteria bacterium]